MGFKERVFSGVQPTGNLHLGNYLGAIAKFVALQDRYECIYCVVDLHAITQALAVWGGPEQLPKNTREVTAAFIACGIDPKNISSSIKVKLPSMPSSPGYSTAWPAWAGSTG